MRRARAHGINLIKIKDSVGKYTLGVCLPWNIRCIQIFVDILTSRVRVKAMYLLISKDGVVDEAPIWRVSRSEHIRHILHDVSIMSDLPYHW